MLKMKLLKNIPRKKIIKHIIAAIVVILFLTFGSIKLLGFFTNHGEAFSVPDFTGKTLSEAEELADEKDLRIKVIDSVFNAPGRRGTIVDQNPPRDFKVKSNRRIFVTIKAFNAEIIKMPDFINYTLIQAKADIETYGLKIKKLIYRPSKYDNVVLEQLYKGNQINPGIDIEKGSEITLVLGKSQGMDNTVTPSLIGLTIDEAAAKSADKMLNIGAKIYDETVITHEDSINATINKQRPAKNIAVIPGEEIDIWLSMLKDTIYEDDDVYIE